MRDARFCPVAFMVSLAIGAIILGSRIGPAGDWPATSAADIMRAVEAQLNFEAAPERSSRFGPVLHRD